MTRLQQILEEILESLSRQSDQVEAMVQLGLDSLEQRCLAAIQQVRQFERTVNQREIEIEEACLQAVALQNPVASDLRMVSTILKVNGDLERIADLALNLTERTEALAEFPAVEVPPELADMVRYSLSMVKDAHRALLNRDVRLAQRVCQRDDQLDAMNRELIVRIAALMEAEPSSVKAQLHLFSASRIIERIGDHATNIAEDVIYLVQGEILRHQHKLCDAMPTDIPVIRPGVDQV